MPVIPCRQSKANPTTTITSTALSRNKPPMIASKSRIVHQQCLHRQASGTAFPFNEVTLAKVAFLADVADPYVDYKTVPACTPSQKCSSAFEEKASVPIYETLPSHKIPATTNDIQASIGIAKKLDTQAGSHCWKVFSDSRTMNSGGINETLVHGDLAEEAFREAQAGLLYGQFEDYPKPVRHIHVFSRIGSAPVTRPGNGYKFGETSRKSGQLGEYIKRTMEYRMGVQEWVKQRHQPKLEGGNEHRWVLLFVEHQHRETRWYHQQRRRYRESREVHLDEMARQQRQDSGMSESFALGMEEKRLVFEKAQQDIDGQHVASGVDEQHFVPDVVQQQPTLDMSEQHSVSDMDLYEQPSDLDSSEQYPVSDMADTELCCQMSEMPDQDHESDWTQEDWSDHWNELGV